MARKAHTREFGEAMGRLPGYAATSNEHQEKLPEAVAFRIDVLKFVTRVAATRVNGKKASNETITKSKEILGEVANRLWRLGFKIKNLDAISSKHIEAIVRDYWACGASPKHLAALMTELHKLDDWLKKPGLVKSKEAYLPEVPSADFKVFMVADKSKSWSVNGIDVDLKIAEADRKDKRFGLMLRLCLALGLRRCEVLQVIPWKDDRGTFFDIRPGIAKGGRARTIPYTHEAQKQVVQFVKSQLKRDEHLGWHDGDEPGLKLMARNEGRYAKFMAEIGITKAEAGVTGHGLRAEFAEDMALLLGLIPATRGGTKGQMSRDDEDTIRLQVSENMGHSRLNVTSAYYGKLTKKIQNSRGERLGTIVLSGGKLAGLYMNPPPARGENKEYQRLRKKTIEATDIVVVVEIIENGMSTKQIQFSFKDRESEIKMALLGLPGMIEMDANHDASDLKRIGQTLLAKFGVILLD
jgi:integrase